MTKSEFDSSVQNQSSEFEPRKYNEEWTYREDPAKFGLKRWPSNIGYTCDQGPIPITVDSFIASQILGDGSLVIRRQVPRLDGSIPVELSWTHSAKVKDYVYFKWHIAKRLELKPWKIAIDDNKTRYSKLPAMKSGISTRDQKWIDMPPEKVAEYLDPFGLLIWYLDDGTLGKRTAALHTCAFSRETNEKLCEVIKRKFGLDLHVCMERKFQSDTQYCYLVIEANELRKLIDLTKDYFKYLPSRMLYKLDMKYRYATEPRSYALRFLYDILTFAPSKVDPENLVEQLKHEAITLKEQYRHVK